MRRPDSDPDRTASKSGSHAPTTKMAFLTAVPAKVALTPPYWRNRTVAYVRHTAPNAIAEPTIWSIWKDPPPLFPGAC